MCGKTGTAQVTHGEANSVFVAFAPRKNPKIAIAVVVENSGEGAHWAAPIASFIVEQYLKGSISKRESGITVEYFANANKLPDLSYKLKGKTRPLPADSVKKLKQDSLNRQKGLKSVSAGKRKYAPARV
jgi:penicillin-binding protein 2